MRTVKTPKVRWLVLPAAAVLGMAASPPPRTYDLRFSSNDTNLTPPTRSVISRAPASSFDVAPTPNRDISAPLGPAASNDARLSPGLFSRGRQNRGEGFLAGSSAQEEQDKRAMPGAGFNLTMPLSK